MDIDEVVQWDGQEEILDDDGDAPMFVGDETPPPPERVREVYAEATGALEELRADPDNMDVQSRIQSLNESIKRIASNGVGDTDRWTIPVSFFKPHYALSLIHI